LASWHEHSSARASSPRASDGIVASKQRVNQSIVQATDLHASLAHLLRADEAVDEWEAREEVGLHVLVLDVVGALQVLDYALDNVCVELWLVAFHFERTIAEHEEADAAQDLLHLRLDEPVGVDQFSWHRALAENGPSHPPLQPLCAGPLFLLPLPQLLGLIFPCLIFSIISSAIGCLRVSIIHLLAALKSMLQLQFFRLLFIQMAVVPLLQLPFQRQIERSSVRIVAFGGIKQKVSRWIGIQLLEKSFGVRVVADYLDFAKVGFAGLVGASAGIGT